jgi:putative oxidoreductase
MNIEAIAAPWAPRLLSVLRIVSGLLFLQHGTAKHLKFPAIEMFAKLEPLSLIGIAGLFELVGGVLLVLGLGTRIVAFLLCGLMAFAYFISHAPAGFFPIVNRGELAVLYCFVFLYIAAAGPGPWSLDSARRK